MKKLSMLLGVILALAALYYWVAVDSRMPADANFTLDLAEVRKLAASVPGPRPAAIRYEHVSTFVFPRAMVTAGDDWSTVPIPAYVYRLDYPDSTVVIDAAM